MNAEAEGNVLLGASGNQPLQELCDGNQVARLLWSMLNPEVSSVDVDPAQLAANYRNSEDWELCWVDEESEVYIARGYGELQALVLYQTGVEPSTNQIGRMGQPKPTSRWYAEFLRLRLQGGVKLPLQIGTAYA